MAIISSTGTPFLGYISLATAGALNIPIWTVMGSAATYTLKANERLVVTNLQVSSNDTVAALVTIDTGGGTPTKLLSAYLSTTQFLQPEEIPAGICHGIFGTPLRANISAVTGGKTVEIVLVGFVSATG